MLITDIKTQNAILSYMVSELLEDKTIEEKTEFGKRCFNHVIHEKYVRTRYPIMNIEIKNQ